MVEYRDAAHHVDRAGILQRPKGKIPILYGGFSGSAYERAARIGDGIMFSGRSQTKALAIKADIQARLAEPGRANDEFGFQPSNNTPMAIINGLAISRHGASGGSDISVVTMGANHATVDGHIDAIRRRRDVYNSIR